MVPGDMPEWDGLFILHRFSNADKHCFITAFSPLPQTINFGESVNVIEWVPVPQTSVMEPDREHKIGRVRFAPPIPTQLNFDAQMAVTLAFSTPPAPNHKSG